MMNIINGLDKTVNCPNRNGMEFCPNWHKVWNYPKSFDIKTAGLKISQQNITQCTAMLQDRYSETTLDSVS